MAASWRRRLALGERLDAADELGRRGGHAGPDEREAHAVGQVDRAHVDVAVACAGSGWRRRRRCRRRRRPSRACPAPSACAPSAMANTALRVERALGHRQRQPDDGGGDGGRRAEPELLRRPRRAPTSRRATAPSVGAAALGARTPWRRARTASRCRRPAALPRDDVAIDGDGDRRRAVEHGVLAGEDRLARRANHGRVQQRAHSMHLRARPRLADPGLAEPRQRRFRPAAAWAASVSALTCGPASQVNHAGTPALRSS